MEKIWSWRKSENQKRYFRLHIRVRFKLIFIFFYSHKIFFKRGIYTASCFYNDVICEFLNFPSLRDIVLRDTTEEKGTEIGHREECMNRKLSERKKLEKDTCLQFYAIIIICFLKIAYNTII